MVDIYELRKQANELPAATNLGKNGITPTFIETVDKYLKAHSIMKIKVSIAEDKDQLKQLAEELAKKTKSKVVETKGYTMVLYRAQKIKKD